MADKHENSRAKSGMGGSKKSSKSKGKKPSETHIKHFKHGGHMVTHHYKSEDGSMPEEGEPEMMGDKNALMSHLQDTIPDNGAAQSTPPPDPNQQAAQAGPVSAPAAPAAPQQGA